MSRRVVRCGKCFNGTEIVGYILLAAGIVLLFVCIPVWAWAALGGVLLMAAGCAVLRLCKAWR